MARGFVGQATGNAGTYNAESMVLEKSSAPFGVVLVSDDDGLCRLPDKANALVKGASTGVAVGVLIRQESDSMPCNTALALPIGNGETIYAKEGFAVSLMRTGTIFVKTETDVKRNDAVYYRVEKTATTKLGEMRNDSDTDKSVKLNGAVFMHGASAGEIVEVTLNLNTVQESY